MSANGGRRGFGRPAVFSNHITQTQWQSFTVTLYDPAFFAFMEGFTGNAAGTGAEILAELFHHFKLADKAQSIIDK